MLSGPVMEKSATTTIISEAKYQKLASEYSKLRAQAVVLRRALIDEQEEKATLKDQLRQQQTGLRRSEQEVDSLGFRNRQLEHRVSVLQEEIATREGRKREKETKRGTKTDAAAAQAAGNGSESEFGQDALIFEELQKRIMENAHLTSLVDDKQRDLLLHADRISNLEQSLQKQVSDQNDLEKRWRRDLETLQQRNVELESKLVEAASIFGSEDALSVSGSDNTPLHNTGNSQQVPHNHNATTEVRSNEERLAMLEKEVACWRTQYEIAKLNEIMLLGGSSSSKEDETIACSCSTTAAGLLVKPSFVESKSSQHDLFATPPPSREQVLFNHMSRKYEELLEAKCQAESHLSSYELEASHLQNCLENATFELKAKDEQVQSINQALQMLEEDLATTRINYEEQISVMTEQVISLSEQLAASK